MHTGFPTFRGYGLDSKSESRLSRLLSERCRSEGISMGTLEASEVAADLYAAHLRQTRGAPLVPDLARPSCYA